MHGNLINRFMERSSVPALEVGMGVTETRWSDRVAYTLVEIVNAKTVVVQEDHAIRTDGNGMSDAQSYRYERNPEGRRVTLTLRNDGVWRAQGEKKRGASGWLFGARRAYHDYSF